MAVEKNTLSSTLDLLKPGEMTDITEKEHGRQRPNGGSPIQAQISPELNLAQARRNRGLSLEHIAEVTKISVRFLEAIEAEDFHKLPGGVYAVSYVRQYAKFVGCDEGLLLERCTRISNPEAVSNKVVQSIMDQAAAPRPRQPLLRVPSMRIRIRLTVPRVMRFARQPESQLQ